MKQPCAAKHCSKSPCTILQYQERWKLHWMMRPFCCLLKCTWLYTFWCGITELDRKDMQRCCSHFIQMIRCADSSCPLCSSETSCGHEYLQQSGVRQSTAHTVMHSNVFIISFCLLAEPAQPSVESYFRGIGEARCDEVRPDTENQPTFELDTAAKSMSRLAEAKDKVLSGALVCS